jgi:hypothetical protein
MPVKKKPITRGTESRKEDWESQVAQFKKSHFAFEQNHAVQQELLKDLSIKLSEKWGVDLAKLTKSSRAAFERIGQQVKDLGVADSNEETKS